MTFPLDLFISPQQTFKSDGSGMRLMGEAGEMMQRERLQKMQLQQAEAHFQQQQGLQRDELKSIDRYRNDQIDARKQAMSDKENDKRDQRVHALLVELRKTKPGSNERNLIIQELQSLGQAVTDEDTELPEPAPPPAALSPLDIAPDPTAKGIKGKPPSPGFKKALDAEMQKEDQFGLEEPPPEEPTPMDFGALGIPPEITPQKKRGGKTVVRDQKGNLVMSYDEPVEKQKNLSSMKSILGPIVSNARSPEEKAAAQAALDTALGAMDSGGYTVKEAAERGEKVHKDMMGRYKTERRPGSIPTGGGGAGGLSAGERARRGQAANFGMSVVRESRQQEVVGEARKQLSLADDMMDLINQAREDGNNFAGRAALAEHLHANYGSAQTKTEVGGVIGGSGKLVELENELNKYIKGGEMPPELLDGLQTVAEAKRKVLMQRIQESADSVADMITDTPSLYTPEEATKASTAARNFIMGKKPTGETNDVAADRARADEWLKKRKSGGK